MANGQMKEQLITKMENFFSDDSWKSYEYDERYSVFQAGINLPDTCKLKNTNMYAECRENGLFFRFTINIGTDDNCEREVMEYITRVNNTLVYGAFQMDVDRNNVEYAMFLPCEDVPSNDLIDATIITALSTMNRYGNELLAVIFGMMTAKEAFETVQERLRG